MQTTDTKGKAQSRTIEYSDGKGTLELAGRKVSVKPKVTYGFGKTQGVYRGPGKSMEPAESVRLNAWLTLRASELGLKLPGDATEIDVRIGMTGFAPPAQAK